MSYALEQYVQRRVNPEAVTGVTIVGFADDVVLTVSGETLDYKVEMLATAAIDTVESCEERLPTTKQRCF